MNICVIPARGGSKRIPGKNTLEFCGKPILAWSIEAAIGADCFERIIVTTDNEVIADLARRLGAEIPFMRPASLADDHTGTVDVVRHAAQWLHDHDCSFDYLCCIYATAPFTTPEDIRRGLEVLQRESCDYAISVTSFPFPIQRAVRVSEQNRLAMLHPEHLETRSQDLQESYHDAGQFYWGTAAAWHGGNPLFCGNSAPVYIPRHRVQDIDTLEDWTRAEALFRVNRALDHPG